MLWSPISSPASASGDTDQSTTSWSVQPRPFPTSASMRPGNRRSARRRGSASLSRRSVASGVESAGVKNRWATGRTEAGHNSAVSEHPDRHRIEPDEIGWADDPGGDTKQSARSTSSRWGRGVHDRFHAPPRMRRSPRFSPAPGTSPRERARWLVVSCWAD
jgi:hypothetical protein